MDFLFGKRKTPEEMLRQNQRALTRAMRDLDRERQRLEQQEKKIIADIKKMAKQGQMDWITLLCSGSLIIKLLVKAGLDHTAVQRESDSQPCCVGALHLSLSLLQLKLPQIQKIMMEFEKQAEIMDMKEEMMNDAIDDAMGDEDDEEESDAVVSQVLDELGLTLTDELSNLPSTGGKLSVQTGKKAEPTPTLADADADLEERLNNLRRD
ncbi:CHM2A protein, partial [Polyodon spathula]|nr:CHM2A protein [Polyodon spathula]